MKTNNGIGARTYAFFVIFVSYLADGCQKCAKTTMGLYYH